MNWAESIQVQHRLTGKLWFEFSAKNEYGIKVFYNPHERKCRAFTWFWLGPGGTVLVHGKHHSAETLNRCFAGCKDVALERVF